MTAQELIDVIVSERIEVSPQVNDRNEIVSWSAGFKTPAGKGDVKGWVLNYHFAKGSTIHEAVTKLLNHETVYQFSSELGLVKRNMKY